MINIYSIIMTHILAHNKESVTANPKSLHYGLGLKAKAWMLERRLLKFQLGRLSLRTSTMIHNCSPRHETMALPVEYITPQGMVRNMSEIAKHVIRCNSSLDNWADTTSLEMNPVCTCDIGFLRLVNWKNSHRALWTKIPLLEYIFSLVGCVL